MSTVMDKIFSPIKQRLIKYLEYKEISKEEFYKITGISGSNFKGKGLESELGGDKIAKILSIFGEISAEWFINGNGPMIKSLNNNYNVANEQPGNYSTADICAICREKDRTIDAMRMANQALQVALNTLQHQANAPQNNNLGKTG